MLYNLDLALIAVFVKVDTSLAELFDHFNLTHSEENSYENYRNQQQGSTEDPDE